MTALDAHVPDTSGGVPVARSRPRYRVTKTYGHDLGLSACFRQWRADSHCRHLHGYALAVTLEFTAEDLDDRGWVLDFGALKPVKEMLVSLLDHRTLVAEDDPELERFEELHRRELVRLVILPAVGCEAFARLIFNTVWHWLRTSGHAPRVNLSAVEVREHGANAARVEDPG